MTTIMQGRASADGPVKAHALRHGLPVCGFTRVMPRDWPDGHAWVSFQEWWAFVETIRRTQHKAMPVGFCDECYKRMEN